MNVLQKAIDGTVGRGRYDPSSLTILAVVAGLYGIDKLVKYAGKQIKTKEENK